MKIFVLGTRGFPGVQGGVEKHCQELYPLLTELGVEVTVFSRSPYFPKKRRIPEWKKVKFVYLTCLKKKNFEAVIHTFLSSLLCILQRPDIAHFHNLGPALFVPLVKLSGIRCVLTYHSINYQHQKWGRFGKSILKLGEFLGVKFADRVIVISQATKDFLEKKYSRKDLQVIPNGVTLHQILPPGETLTQYDLIPKRYVFTACRFTPEKGLHNLIAAYDKIENPAFKLVIAGDADHETEYSRNLKKVANSTSGIVLTGFISGEPLQELYSNAGLFVLPSYYEGLPIALLEAISYDLPVLASDIPQNREIPLPGFRYFKPGDIETLARKMDELFRTGISEEEKKKQRRILEENYNWDKIAQQTFEVYKSVLNFSV